MFRGTTILCLSAVLVATFVSPASAGPFSTSGMMARAKSISVAKGLIRSLYYGYQQAQQEGWSSLKNYIVAHNYPGMYSDPRGCLSNYSMYDDIMPNLSTVGKEASWKIPSGIYANKLSGKKVRGETFVYQVTSAGAQSFNHATILNGKAYFYLWICNASKPQPIDATVAANRAYATAALALGNEESNLLSRYTSVTGTNYTSDSVVYNAMTSLIPDVQSFLSEINSIQTPTADLFATNQYWISAWTSYLSCFTELQAAIQDQSRSEIAQANQYLNQGRASILQFQNSFRNLKR